MIRTLTDLLRMFGDAPVTHVQGVSNGRETEIRLVVSHAPRCPFCDDGCDSCEGTGLAVELGVSHAG